MPEKKQDGYVQKYEFLHLAEHPLRVVGSFSHILFLFIRYPNLLARNTESGLVVIKLSTFASPHTEVPPLITNSQKHNIPSGKTGQAK